MIDSLGTSGVVGQELLNSKHFTVHDDLCQNCQLIRAVLRLINAPMDPRPKHEPRHPSSCTPSFQELCRHTGPAPCCRSVAVAQSLRQCVAGLPASDQKRWLTMMKSIASQFRLHPS